MKGDPSEYFLVQILDNEGKSEFKWVNSLNSSEARAMFALRSCAVWGLLKDIKIQTRLTCYSLTLIFWFVFICRRTSHTRQCECVLRPEFKYGIFAVQTQEKGRWKAELRYVFEFVSMFIVKLRFTSIVSTSWIEEGQVLISENHWNGRWILSPLS